MTLNMNSLEQHDIRVFIQASNCGKKEEIT